MRRLAVVLSVTPLLTGCGGDSSRDAAPATQPSVLATTTQATVGVEPGTGDTLTVDTNASASGGFSGVFADTYEAARQICHGAGVAAIAEQFGSAPEPKAAARAYADNLADEQTRHHDASYAGCLKGFSESS